MRFFWLLWYSCAFLSPLIGQEGSSAALGFSIHIPPPSGQSSSSCYASKASSTADTTPTSRDVHIVQEQLTYLPTNFVGVSARNRLGHPIAIQTYPLITSGSSRRQLGSSSGASLRESWSDARQTAVANARPFPTLYWLTCPLIARAIADLERQGYVSILQERLQTNPTCGRLQRPF